MTESTAAQRSMVAALVLNIGGMLVAPRQTLSAAHRGARGGLRDFALLLAAAVVAVHLPRLFSSLWFTVAVSYRAGISTFLNTIADAVIVPVVAVFVGSLAISFMTRGYSGRERNTDLAALSVLPAVCLELLLTLAAAIGGWQAGPLVRQASLLAGAVWIVALIVIAVGVVRAGGPEQEST